MSQFDAAADRLELPKILHRIQFYASSDLGKEAAESIEPLDDIETISREHNLVSEMKRVLEGEGSFPIDGIKDIRASLQQSTIENNLLSAKELLSIASTLQSSRTIKSFVDKRKEYLIQLHALTSAISIFKEIEFNINQAIDDNASVKDSASKELRSIRQSIADKQSAIRRTLEKILRATAEQGMVRDEIVTTRDGRMVIPIKAELKNKFPGFIHSTSSTGQTVFIEPSETLTYNNEITELFFKEKREVERILRELTRQIFLVVEQIRQIVEILTQIDLCFAKARYSIEIKANKPFLKDTGSLSIRQGYHPVLLLRHHRDSVVPLDIEVGASYNTLLITGPNAGGKTVALKALGILSLMVQSGIHIPVSPDSEFPVFKKIFVLIGDNQSLDNDLSTYSSQILQIKKITEHADVDSLVLIDEIGSNTDPTEGGAIAAAVIEHLNGSGAITVATSHQASLKAFVHNSLGMENGAMEFDQETLIPTYRFKPGLPGSSYALEIAQRLGVNDSIITTARGMLGEQKAKLEQLILDLENRSQLLQQKLSNTEGEINKYKELSQVYETKLKDLNREVRDIKRKAIEEAKVIIDRAASTVENTVREIKTQQADREVIRKGKEKIAALEKEVSSLEKDISETISSDRDQSIEIKLNDTVVLRSGGQTGTVLTMPDKNGNLQVAFNSIKAKVHISNIKSVTKKEAKKITVSASFISDKPYTTEVDIRGLYGDEAIEIVDKFIDDALMAGLHRVDIIHGHGTGALRKRIHSFLETDHRIKSQRFGERYEGGAGVTVVEIAE
ncbi:MAG: endonuclease MutS2 [Bacteroidetes bacterium]|nr:endonuclease MutS2 [Bacteroidota bacterium]